MTFPTWSPWLAATSSGWPEWLPAAFALLVLPGIFYWIATAALLARRARRQAEEPGKAEKQGGIPSSCACSTLSAAPPPPVTFLRPVKNGVPDLGDKARRLLGCARPGDRVLFGVDGREEFAICEAACAEAPEGVGAAVVFCAPASGGAAARNPKIEKLIALCCREPWGPEHWILTDSEALPDRAFMDALRAEWAAYSAGAKDAKAKDIAGAAREETDGAAGEEGAAVVMTAGYRFRGATALPQQLDQMAALLTLWPGLAAAEWGSTRASRWRNGSSAAAAERGDLGPGLGFALGACIAVRKGDVARAGGWEAFSGYLAEDNRLGAALAAEGRPTRLSKQILTLDSDPIGWLAWLLHQHRVAFTYRVCNPAGAFAMVFTHAVSWSLLALAWRPASPWAWSLFGAVAALRIATARRNARSLRFFHDLPPLRFAIAAVAASLAETVFWLVAWLPLPVFWGGGLMRVDARGCFIPAGPTLGAAFPKPAAPESAAPLGGKDRP